MPQIDTSYFNRQEELAVTVARVLDKMDNNEYFPYPPAALAQLKILLPEFYSSMANALSRDKLMISIKNDKKAEVTALLQEVIGYVTQTSKGDRTMMLSSGFDVFEDYNSKVLLAKIEILEVELGPPGEATTRVRKAKNARAYIHQYTTEPPGPNTIWAYEGSALSRYTFKGLASDKRHWFRVIAIGSGTQRTFSPVISRVIQ
jgi:hypothetical protein